jgi:precorrin-6B methylase 2
MNDTTRPKAAEDSAAARPRQPNLPPGFVLYQLATGHYISHALALIVKLGIPDHIRDEACSAEDLAAATSTQAHALRRVLRLLVSVGIFAEDSGGGFTLTELGQLLRNDIAGSMRAFVGLFAGELVQGDWAQLEYCVRTGNPAFWKDRPGSNAFAAMAERDPELAADFDAAMAANAPTTAAAVAAAYDFSSVEHIIDVGGGNGAILTGLVQAFPHLRGTVFDLPASAERAKANLQAGGMEKQIDVSSGSFFDAVPAGADIYLMKHIIHDWNDEDATKILKVCRAAMSDSARLLIVEGLYPEQIDQSLAARSATANDVNMLVCAGGRQRREAEFQTLFAGAGLALRRVVPTSANVSVIEATPAS